MPSFRTISAKVVVVLLAASLGGQTTVANAACNADNCLRALRKSVVISKAQVFCSAFTAGAWDSAEPLPTYAVNCRASAPAISSACSCLAATTTISPSSTLPIPSASSTLSIASSTTSASTPAYSGPAGYKLIPNSLFEDDEPSWITVEPDVGHMIVNISTDGSFTGLFGPRMLRFSLDPTRPIRDCKMLVPVNPHPDGRDWTITAFFRTDARDFSRCRIVLDYWVPALGEGGGSFPDFTTRGWQIVPLRISNSAAGIPGGVEIALTGLCQNLSGFVYVDGLYLS
ncbi:hypothetical protein F5X68DRAFT_2228 [Plectosphaerella plurivora]|uniref:Uncharacterized protein n=1 Tax=Plectosphaerella plurivora TaxID=936078 RepID=A0A9P8VP75_9PEZI|nr:hypothetical protein F5X68DRAFT_2228 [Plectosphaerella plurivora]